MRKPGGVVIIHKPASTLIKCQGPFVGTQAEQLYGLGWQRRAHGAQQAFTQTVVTVPVVNNQTRQYRMTVLVGQGIAKDALAAAQ